MADPALHQTGDTILDCPHCGEAGRHRVVTDRDGTLLWCQTCFRVRDEGPVRVRAEAERFNRTPANGVRRRRPGPAERPGG